MIPEQLRMQRIQDAASGDWWSFIFWGHNLIRLLPPGAPAESAVTANFGVDLEFLRLPKILPLKVSVYWWHFKFRFGTLTRTLFSAGGILGPKELLRRLPIANVKCRIPNFGTARTGVLANWSVHLFIGQVSQGAWWSTQG